MSERIVCLRSYMAIVEQDPLGFLVQRLHGWFEPQVNCVDHYVLESRAYMLYILDPNLERIYTNDYIV